MSYVYDNLGRLTQANQSLNNLAFGYDALSRKISEGGPLGSTGFGYDAASERTSVTYSTSGGGSALTANYAYLLTGELSSIKQGANTLSSYAYDALGNRTSATFGNGASQVFTYDPVSRLASLTNDLSGTANDLTVNAINYNPASQLKGLTRSNDAYAFTPLASGTTNSVADGLNRPSSIGGVTVGWADGKGNLTTDPTTSKTYGYSSENLLTSGSGGVTLTYDPALRLYQVAGATMTRFAYEGPDAIAEYNSSNALQRRFVYDDAGQPVVQYEGTGTSTPRYLSEDERGSVISVTDGSGAVLALNKYDEYGNTQSTNPPNQGRFGYTGQNWLSEIGAYDYKARVYLPHLGIFAQTDPIGTAGGMNIYGYVGGDPVNSVDPFGMDLSDLAVPTGSHIPGGMISTQQFDSLGGWASGSANGGERGSGVQTGGTGASGSCGGAPGLCRITLRDLDTGVVQSISYEFNPGPNFGVGAGQAGNGNNISPESSSNIIITGTRRIQLASASPWGWLEVLRGYLDLKSDSCQTCVEPLRFANYKSPQKWLRQMAQRGWDTQLIRAAILTGQSFPAQNNINPSNGAVRYVSPTNGQSVVVDAITGEIIHLGGPGFAY